MNVSGINKEAVWQIAVNIDILSLVLRIYFVPEEAASAKKGERKNENTCFGISSINDFSRDGAACVPPTARAGTNSNNNLHGTAEYPQ